MIEIELEKEIAKELGFVDMVFEARSLQLILIPPLLAMVIEATIVLAKVLGLVIKVMFLKLLVKVKAQDCLSMAMVVEEEKEAEK